MLSPPQDHPDVPIMAATAAAMAKEAAAAEMVAVSGAGGGERKRKKTLGRQKIEIKRINCIEARHVCFSKRRAGLFKKAFELSVRTGAHLGIVVFSPADKPYSIGHSSVNAVLDRYCGDPASYVPPTAEAAAAEVAALDAAAREYEVECERLQEAIKAEGRRRVELDAAAARAAAAGAWNVDGDLRGVRMPELVAMLAALERVQAEAVERTREIIAEEAIMQHYAAAGAGAGAGFHLQYPYPGAGAGTFVADGGAGGSGSSHLGSMDTRMMLMGGDVISHALPFAPMMLPGDLPPPQPPVLPQAFNYGYEDNHFAGYGGYGYDLLGDGGSGHGAAYEMKGLAGDGGMEGYCYGTTTTCNFFG
ncbi:unnamed protein product [Urochloa decumbens]|uniref:MADS-box domain-containing protein n=1 Tax=Urochloa decumbens TaxID=240449 RepID=A0ABC9A508_9POAL